MVLCVFLVLMELLVEDAGFFLAGAGADCWPRMRAGTQRQGELLAAFMIARGEGLGTRNLAQDCIDFIVRHVVVAHDFLICRQPFSEEFLIGLHERLPGEKR